MIKPIIVGIATLRTTGFAYIVHGHSLTNGLLAATISDQMTEHRRIFKNMQ